MCDGAGVMCQSSPSTDEEDSASGECILPGRSLGGVSSPGVSIASHANSRASRVKSDAGAGLLHGRLAMPRDCASPLIAGSDENAFGRSGLRGRLWRRSLPPSSAARPRWSCTALGRGGMLFQSDEAERGTDTVPGEFWIMQHLSEHPVQWYHVSQLRCCATDGLCASAEGPVWQTEEEECKKRRHGVAMGVLTQQGHIAMAWRTKEGLHKVVHHSRPGLVHTAQLAQCFFPLIFVLEDAGNLN